MYQIGEWIYYSVLCFDTPFFNQMKTMKYQLLLLAVLLTGCKETSKVVEFNETLSAESVVLAEAMFSVPMDVQKVDDVLYASSFNGDSLLHCYSLARGEWIQSLLPQGQGPGEFISPVEVFFQSDSLLFVHNRWRFTARSYRLDTSRRFLEAADSTVRLPMNVDRIIPVSGSRYVASGVFDDCRFLVLDSQGRVLSRCGNFPDYQDGEDGFTNTVKAMFHQSQFGYNALCNRLACVTGNVFELWDCAADSLTLHARILLSPYHYRYVEGPDGVFAETDRLDSELGARDVCVSDSCIYILYNPNTHRMHEEEAETLNSEIWVFDWQGTPLRKILTDTRIDCFCVDESRSTFYCVMHSPDLCIGSIKLPESEIRGI